jgi:hypothetical protein
LFVAVILDNLELDEDLKKLKQVSDTWESKRRDETSFTAMLTLDHQSKTLIENLETVSVNEFTF